MKKVVFITGASSGMGKATALELIKHDYIVYCGAIDIENMEDLSSLGGKIIKVDVTKHDENAQAITQIIENEGRIDVLFNNAGYGCFGAVEDIPLDEMRHQFDVNLFAIADLTQLVLPHMRNQKEGLIINNSSVSGKIYSPLGAWYHASKHALEAFSDCLRMEVRQFGIKVVLLEPGLTETNWVTVASASANKYSGQGLYSDMVEDIGIYYRLKIFKPTKAEKIAKIVHKIIMTKKPKNRYLVGQLAKLLVFTRRVFGDRFFDWTLKIGRKL